jgi:hypothetical protein
MDRNRDERITILGNLFGEIAVFQRMAIREISRGGAKIETPVPLHLNSLHQLRLMLGDRSVIVQGRVVHSRLSHVSHGQSVYLSGVEFVDVPSQVDVVIQAYIQSIKAAT